MRRTAQGRAGVRREAQRGPGSSANQRRLGIGEGTHASASILAYSMDKRFTADGHAQDSGGIDGGSRDWDWAVCSEPDALRKTSEARPATDLFDSEVVG